MAGFTGQVPTISITPPKFKLVPCPKCGFKETLIVEQEGEKIFIRDFKTPRTCMGCGQPYQLTWRLEIGAEKIGG